MHRTQSPAADLAGTPRPDNPTDGTPAGDA